VNSVGVAKDFTLIYMSSLSVKLLLERFEGNEGKESLKSKSTYLACYYSRTAANVCMMTSSAFPEGTFHHVSRTFDRETSSL